MRKSALLLLLVCLLGCVASASAQTTLQAREAEWKNYAVPQTNFARQINPDKNFVFRVPANWEQEGNDLTFKGPHSSILRVFVQKVPDGYPLQDFFASILQAIKDTPGAESTITRKTQLQDLEAREIFLETTNSDGEVFRSTSWITVKGPLSVMFNLQVPGTHAAEIEPFFKAVVQSVIFVSPDYPAFEALRSFLIRNPNSGPIHEIESIVTSLIDVNPDREAAIARLTSLFASHADTAIDLLQDRRPFVRAAAVQAVARSNNSTLTPFLWEMVDDDEPFIAEAAARVVASAPDVVAKTLKQSQSGFKTATIARIWSFMSRDKRIELLQRIFNETAVSKTSPPPVTKPGVKVTVTALEPVRPGTSVPDIIGVSNDPNAQIGALTLLSTVAVDDFKLPLARIMAANYDPLIAVALQVSHLRGESLPLDPLIKLVASSDQQVSKLAAQSLGLSANVSDIPRVEALISKDSASAKKALDDELKLSVKKIRFRHALREAKSTTESREIISKALSDPLLADFAWRYDCEPTVAGCSPSNTQTPFKNDFAVKPYAENLFPRNAWHYTAITNPGQAVQKFYESLHGLQLDSPRAQSNLILTMGFVRQSLARGLSAPVDAPTLIEYTGIDPNSPIAMAAWTSERAPDTTGLAQRKAIVLRVKDRGRFERAVEQFQRESGSFVDLTDYVSLGTRVIAALPAFLPLTAQAVLSMDPKKPKTTPILSYGFIGDKEWNGLRVKTVEHHWITSDWVVESAATHMVFLGDTVLLTPDLATMRDLLGKANDPGDRQHLADNPEFRKAIASRGDVVYFSNVKSFLAQFAEGTNAKPDDYNIKESGALSLGNATWENSHHLVFAESGWAKPLLPFHPKELSAPRDLLPATTIAYYLMKVDLTSGSLFGEDLETASKRWGLDLKKDVLAELGPECGALVLELPHVDRFEDSATWAAFCKLKSNKLVEALNTGKLFSGVGPAKDFAELKAGEDSYFVTTRNGFMVIANREKALAAFDGKSNLASTRDYSRAVEKVPSGIVAFGGYNLEAAIAAAGKPSGEGDEAQIANIIFSVASAFHSQNFYATVNSGTVEARSSVAMDREGRYAVADLTYLPRATNITFVTVEPSGVPIRDQKRLSNLMVKVRAKAAGPIDNIKDDIKTADQTVEQKSPKELLLTIAARRGGGEKAIELPVKDPQFTEYLKATPEFAVDDQQVKEQARQIAGEDRDAWSVAQKLADWTYKNLEWKHVQSASAAQTLATREADCSEFSALFVAMARSLGLPARTVGGLAYSGKSFGGHAWVEVWAGKWIELDPTWGTHFVDATHIRDASNELVMSAALNLIEIEVVETRRAVADFQKSPSALMQHLLKAIPGKVQSDLEAAIDLETLTDEFMGAGAWSKMNEGEREQMWSAYRRLLKELVAHDTQAGTEKMRLLHLEVKGNVAEATCLLDYADLLLKLRLVRRNDLWHLVEVLQSDFHFHPASETLKPTITNIEKVRAGEKPSHSRVSDFSRVLLLLRSDAEKAVAAADVVLKDKPADQGFRFLKGVGLLELEKEEGTALLKELTSEGFAPAVLKLAEYLGTSEDQNKRAEAITLYERYNLLEPFDPRGLHELASAYEETEACDKAEAAFRKAIERDPGDTYGYVRLVEHLAVHDKIGDVGPVLVAGEKYKAADEDLFGQAMYSLYVSEETAAGEKLALSEPQRMRASYEGNLSLARMYVNDGRHAAAMRYLNTSIRLDPEAALPHVWVAQVHRKMFRWTAALKAAQRAIDLDDEYSEGYYQLACALTRLGRTKEALAALTKSVELDPDQVEYMVEEADLKALSKLPGFKKLIPEPAKK